MYFRREVDARLHCEMFDYCVVQHEAVGVLAVTRLRMFQLSVVISEFVPTLWRLFQH